LPGHFDLAPAETNASRLSWPSWLADAAIEELSLVAIERPSDAVQDPVVGKDGREFQCCIFRISPLALWKVHLTAP